VTARLVVVVPLTIDIVSVTNTVTTIKIYSITKESTITTNSKPKNTKQP